MLGQTSPQPVAAHDIRQYKHWFGTGLDEIEYLDSHHLAYQGRQDRSS
jgi:hypothetical protein